jgi:pimeloyl-ACP methyl ester carboxylesterase
MQEVAEINMASYWKRVDVPVLLMHGAADFISSSDEHAYVRDIVNHYHPGRAEYLEIPNTDHFFLTAENEADAYKVLTEGIAGREFNDAALLKILDFCREVAGIAPEPELENGIESGKIEKAG